MIKRIKGSKLLTLKDLEVEVLVIDRGNYFEAHLGDYHETGTWEDLALNHLTRSIQGREIFVDGVKVKIPFLRLL